MTIQEAINIFKGIKFIGHEEITAIFESPDVYCITYGPKHYDGNYISIDKKTKKINDEYPFLGVKEEPIKHDRKDYEMYL